MSADHIERQILTAENVRPRPRPAAPPSMPSNDEQQPNTDEAGPHADWIVVPGVPGFNGGLAAIRVPRRRR